MSRVTVFAKSLLACLVLALAAGAAEAQSPYLYVGADSNQANKGAGTATVSAFGTVASGEYAFINADTSTANFKGLSAFGTGQITVTGGTFQQLVAGDSSVINLIGYNFTQSKDYYTDSVGAWYTVSGTLQQDNTPFTAQFYAPSTGTLQFDGVPAVPSGAPVPEASTVVSFALLLAGAGWLAIKRRKAVA